MSDIDTLLVALSILFFFIYIGNYPLFIGLVERFGGGYIFPWIDVFLTALSAIFKVTVTTVLIATASIPYILSHVTPQIGKGGLFVKSIGAERLNWLESDVEYIRGRFVEILGPDFSLSDPPVDSREEVQRVRETALRHQEAGELTLSLMAAVLLISIELTPYNFLPLAAFNQISFGLIFKIYLPLLTLSILYRKFVLKKLSFESPPENFAEFENAVVAYQMGVAKISVIQILMIGLVAARRVYSESQFELAMQAVEDRYREDLNLIQTLRRLWSYQSKR